MRWKAYLDGHSYDIEALIDLFRDGSIIVGRINNEPYLSAAKLDDYDDAVQVQGVATGVLRSLNGVASALDPSFQPVRLIGRYEDGSANYSAVVAADTITIRAQVTASGAVTNGPTAPSPARGHSYIELEHTNVNVADAFRLLGTTDDLSWADLFKLFEIVKHDLTTNQQSITSMRWLTKTQVSAFGASANRPDVSGDDARHARVTGPAPSNTLNLETARELIHLVVREWLDWNLHGRR